MTKKDIEKLIIDYGNFRDKVKTFEELIPYENNLINKLNEAINYTRSCETLPNESEMMHKRYKEYHLAIKNLETIQSGSFYSGFRRCWSWLKSYELVED